MNIFSNHRFKYALISGALIGFSFPPFFGFFSFVGFVPLITIWSSSSIRESAKYSYIAALVANIISLYWIGLNSGAELIPVIASLVAAVLYLSLFWALLGAVCSYFIKRYINGLYLIPALWVSMELLRSYGPLAFSWSSLALTQSNFLPILQIMDITGSEGVSFWVLIVNVFLFSLVQQKKFNYKKHLTFLFIIFIPMIYGSVKLFSFDESEWKKRSVSILQPNIDPNLKWETSFREQLYSIMDSLNVVAFEQKPDLVLWPEAALPNYMRVSTLKNKYLKLVEEKSTPLMMGTLDYNPSSSNRKYFNGSIYFKDDGFQIYHKIFLVPFAEYIPLSLKFPILNKLNFGQGNFSQGKEFTQFPIDSISFSNMICYDITDPLLVKNFVKNGARFLTVEANVAWLQNSSGVRQFFEIAKLRAIELRTGIALSANTGISGIINPFGKVIKKMDFNRQGVIKGEVMLNKELTFYAKSGNIFAKLCFLCVLLCPFILRKK